MTKEGLNGKFQQLTIHIAMPLFVRIARKLSIQISRRAWMDQVAKVSSRCSLHLHDSLLPYYQIAGKSLIKYPCIIHETDTSHISANKTQQSLTWHP